MIKPRLFGHPLHAMIAGFPVAFWCGGVLWDAASLLRPEILWPQMALWTLALGLAAALPALVTGFWELVVLPRGHPAEGKALRHMGLMSAAFCCILVSVLLRRNGAETASPPSGGAMLAAFAGVALTLAGGWMGGELVFRHGLGMEKEREPRRTSEGS